MGTNREKISVDYDTGSAIYLAEIEYATQTEYFGCYTDEVLRTSQYWCPYVPSLYEVTDEFADGTFKFIGGEHREEYGDGTIMKGQWATDQVCATNSEDSCVKTFKWVACNIAVGLNLVDGILGMKQTHTEHEDVLYVPALYKEGSISENTFSFFLTSNGALSNEDDSYIDFGTPDESAMSNVEDLIWITSTNYQGTWSNYVSGMRWKESGEKYDNFTRTFAFTDTGTSCILAPRDVANFIIEGIKANVTTTITD